MLTSLRGLRLVEFLLTKARGIDYYRGAFNSTAAMDKSANLADRMCYGAKLQYYHTYFIS